MPELFNYSYRLLNLNQAGTLTDFEYPIEGQKLIYMAPTDGPQLSVKLQAKSNDGIPLRPQGQIVAPFQRLYISGVIGAALPILIVASPAGLSIESRDVNVNSIATLSTITNPVISKDYTLDRALAGQIFERSTYISNSVGNYTLYQVYNPVGSGKTVVVLGLRYQHDAAAGNRTRIVQYNTQLSTLIGTLHNIQSGGSASAATFRSEQPAAFPAGNVLDEFPAAVVLDNNNSLRSRVDILSEGEGLVVGSLAVNCSASCTARVLEF